LGAFFAIKISYDSIEQRNVTLAGSYAIHDLHAIVLQRQKIMKNYVEFSRAFKPKRYFCRLQGRSRSNKLISAPNNLWMRKDYQQFRSAACGGQSQ
jgi:hypothetical protein